MDQQKGIVKTGRDNEQQFTSTSAGIGKKDEANDQEFLSRTKVNAVKLQEVELVFRGYDGGKGVEDYGIMSFIKIGNLLMV